MASDTSKVLRSLSAAEYERLSKLLDEALELSPEARDAWLASLGESESQVATLLRELLDLLGTAHDGFLEDRPPLLMHLAEAAEAAAGLLGKEFGPYRVCSLLGHGGMGSVWLAERVDGLFKRQVALKLVNPAQMGRGIAERFVREREILAGLNHPNIARLLDAGFAHEGQAYLALEYVRGTPLTTYCDDHRLSLRERLELFRKVLSTVQYAHAHLVIHRDLKPSNILVSEDGEVHLLDFGIAKLMTEGEARETQLTRFGGGVALTPEYAAPEQIAGAAAITTAADVYALGVMLYEILTGERPYRLKRDTRAALEEAILQTDPVPPSRLVLGEAAAQTRSSTAARLKRALKGDLDTIVLRALKKAPAERYATVNALDEDLARFLRGDIVLAQADSMAYRMLKLVRRHRAAIAVASILMLTLTGGLVATTYEARLAARQRDAALEAQLRSLTQTAATRLQNRDAAGALGIVLEVLPHPGVPRSYTPEALSVFQQALAADTALIAATGDGDVMVSAAFSPDGRRIITASGDRTARIWDAGTGWQLIVLQGHTDGVNSAAFSADGRRAVTAADDKTARVWDTTTGRQLTTLSGHTDTVTSAAFSHDGSRIVTSSVDKTARVWEAATGREIMMLTGHADPVNYAEFSPDGRRIVTASVDRSARVWDAGTGRQLMILEGHTERLETASFSPDGRHIVTASGDKTARIWDATTANEIRLLSGHTDRVTSAAFSPDGGRVVTASDDKTTRIWDAATGEPVGLLSGHTDRVTSAAFSPDGRRVVTSSLDRTTRVWDAVPAREQIVLRGHTDRVESASFAPDGRRIITASGDKTARVWDGVTGREIAVLRGHTAQVETASFSPDGQRAVTASDDRTARIWDAATGEELGRLSGHSGFLASAVFAPDGRRVVTASSDKTARIWDARTARQVALLGGHTGWVAFALFSPDGRRVATASEDKTARIWDAVTGRQLVLLRGHTDRLESVAFSPEGSRLATASDDGTARIWDATTGRELVQLRGHTDRVASAVFSPDGRRVATGSGDGTVRVWDAATGQALLVLSGHADRVAFAAFSPDGSRVVSASHDRTARVWDVRAPALESQIRWAAAAQFDPLPDAERFRLGLPASIGVREWPDKRSECDESAAAPYDPDRHAPGVTRERIISDIAITACSAPPASPRDIPRSVYQRGRALMARGSFAAARRDFEDALARGYRAAGIDLAMLLSEPSAATLDVPRALALYEQMWKAGLPIAAFELGNLYQHGVSAPGRNNYLLAPDPTRADEWYLKATSAGEPNALARVAGQEERAALLAATTAQQNADLLGAFRYYAAAAERAGREDWPDDAWRTWRYRQASLARLLARAGMMQEVARAYEGVHERTIPQRLTFRQRLARHVPDQ
jgi:WD40 repeat protein/serine/threonine protein kinase